MGIQTFNVFTFYVTLSLVQVQSYNLNREHYRRKVTLEIRNKKGKLSYLGFLEQERTRNIFVYKKRNNTISTMLGELGTKEEELD